jgi:hypothetical protein
MVNYEALCATLNAKGYTASYFPTARAAADYLDSQIDGVSVGIGGSITAKEMELSPRLSAHNKVIWHWEGGSLAEAATTDVYITSINGLAETGEIINIDGTCNRISAILYGHERVYLVVGRNKIAPDFSSALARARNIAAPKNAQRLGVKTPCSGNADRCYDCKSEERICKGLSVLWEKPSLGTYEIVLIDEDLG